MSYTLGTREGAADFREGKADGNGKGQVDYRKCKKQEEKKDTVAVGKYFINSSHHLQLALFL